MPMSPRVHIKDATLRFGERTIWSDLSLTVAPGEFIAALGPNGTGKTTLIKVLLGLTPLSSGEVRVGGKEPGEDNKHIGYIPQQKTFDRSLPLRGRDLVELGLNGTYFGFRRRAHVKEQVAAALNAVGAESYADMPIGLLSGGEQQRLRIAQALVGEPDLLLCDEPLLSLDLTSQAAVTNLLHSYQERTKAAIIFVTHEINPLLPFVDRVLYIANGQWVIDTPEKVFATSTLSRLYGSPVEVLRHKGRLVVLGIDEASQGPPMEHHGGQV